MLTIRAHIVFFFITTFLVFSIVLPSLEKVNHALTEHITLECDQNIPNHFHEGEYSCDFQTLHLAKVHYPHFQNFDVRYASTNEEDIVFHFQSFTPVSYPYYSLRAPPLTA